MSAAAILAVREEAVAWQTRATYAQTLAQRAEEACAALREQVITLQAQRAALEAYAADLQTRLAQAEAQLEAARGTVAAPVPLAGAVPMPAIVDLVDGLPRSSDMANTYPRRPLADIRCLVLHSAPPDQTTPQQMAQFHVNDPKHRWPGIGFHFFVAADGAIYQTNRLETVSYHLVNGNTTAVGIVVMEPFNSPRQMESTAWLLAWLLQELKLPPAAILGHCEFPQQQTTCPGSGWLGAGGWKEKLLEQVQQRMQSPRRSIYHYVLFWQTATAWAETDWHATARYIARFRPTVGFSPQEAAQAEHVTIIGGPSGVTPEVEQMLRAAGCHVQRIAGKNRRETQSLLDAMANAGQRFVTP